ncbi:MULTISPECIES: lipopolysaccharide biosynthesis protein [unclassified Nocardioides]|uniref:lipopolysaccharide biosynthesis protein n=1 Tax=unclassified Nocardioides TaxID=2615069 RepID=UPI001885BDCC|nr:MULTISPECIES: polysaccharide biosynthesis protein [unclassified Nocardioides]
MTTTQGTSTSGRAGGLRGLLRGTAGIAVAIVVMNVSTYAFQMVAARLLGPDQYGGVASLMAVLLVVAVLQLGLQATAARRISATPEHVGQIERVVLAVTYRAALGLGVLMLLVSPVIWHVLRLDTITPAILLAIAAVPLTVQGGQAGILQGERRWGALGALYLAMGLSRITIGSVCMLARPTEAGAMLGVALALFVPVVVGRLVLRRPREPGEHSAANSLRPVLAEATRSSVALLAFYVLSNTDIVVARNALDSHDAGLYASGLILAKVVLFLPQFVVVLAFPSMSTAGQRRLALLRSLGLMIVLAVCAVLGAVLLSGVAMVFVGGEKYADVEGRLWAFAVLGSLMAMLQLLVYSVLARQGTRSAYLIWLAVAVLVVLSLRADSLDSLIVTVISVDAVLLVALLSLSLWRMSRVGGEDERPAEAPAPSP